MRVIIDRFEGDFAVVEIEEGKFVNLPKVLVSGAQEGDVIDISINYSETEKRKGDTLDLMSHLFE